jgi:hypothetical protein
MLLTIVSLSFFFAA